MAGIEQPHHDTTNDDGEDSPFTGMDAGMSESVVIVFNDPNAANHFSNVCQQTMESTGEPIGISEDGMRFKVPAHMSNKIDSMMEGFLEEGMDLDNGYYSVQDHEELGDYGKDYFPNSQTGTAPERVGPSAAKHGNNPLSAKQFTEEAKNIHENLVYRYREFKNTK